MWFVFVNSLCSSVLRVLVLPHSLFYCVRFVCLLLFNYLCHAVCVCLVVCLLMLPAWWLLCVCVELFMLFCVCV